MNITNDKAVGKLVAAIDEILSETDLSTAVIDELTPKLVDAAEVAFSCSITDQASTDASSRCRPQGGETSNNATIAAPVSPAGQQAPSIDYTPGRWFKARTLDEMQSFYMSRLPAIREAAKEHGYAIGLHGSTRRDFDLMAMQWRDDASDKDTLAHAIAVAACGITYEGAHQWTKKPNGRFAVSLPICWTDHANPDFKKPSIGHIDLSVIDFAAPVAGQQAAPAEQSEAEYYKTLWQQARAEIRRLSPPAPAQQAGAATYEDGARRSKAWDYARGLVRKEIDDALAAEGVSATPPEQQERAVPDGWAKAMRDLVRVLRGVECGDDGQWKFIANVCENAEIALAAAPSPAAPPARCPHCDDTGDVHTPTGEWRGRCTCPAGAAQPVAQVGEQSADDRDPLYDRAVQIVRAHQRASLSLVQRLLCIGYNRSARLFEAMEKAGVVSQMQLSGHRTVLPVEQDQPSAKGGDK